MKKTKDYPSCNGTGKVLPGVSKAKCSSCGGTGELPA